MNGYEFRRCKACGKETKHEVYAGENCVAYSCVMCRQLRELVEQNTEPLGE